MSPKNSHLIAVAQTSPEAPAGVWSNEIHGADDAHP
jgi:hypothetical protein